jgi:hypothetical protein
MAKRLKTLLEGELEKAQVSLAARDVVDQLQKMIEDLTKLKVEEVAALKESIRAAMSNDIANQFVGAVDPALQAAIDAVSQAKDQVDQAALSISGDAEMPGPDMGMGDDMGGEAPPEGGEEMAPTTDAAAGGEDPLGRAKRESRFNKMKAMVEALERKVDKARKQIKKK